MLISQTTRRCAAAALGAVLLAASAGTAAAEADRRALVVGIDIYEDDVLLAPLGGAVADARDLAATFRGLGFTEVTTLFNQEATRERILAEWRRMERASEPGDTFFFTYAGHGMRAPARAPESEEDGMDEFLPLYGFSDRGAALADKIVDDEIALWVARLGERGVQTVIVADACHAGTTFRSVDRRAPGLRFRFAGEVATADIFADLDIDAVLADDDAPPQNLSSFGAALDSQQVPELLLPEPSGQQQARGALSYFFARGARGAADADGDGSVRFDEMKTYVERNIKHATGGFQTPTIVSGDAGGSIITLEPAQEARPQPAAEPSLDQPLRLLVLGFPDEALDLEGVEEVLEGDPADLIWDVQARQALDGLGSVVARDVTARRMQGVVDRRRAARRLAALAETQALEIATDPDQGEFRDGEDFGLKVRDLELPHLTLFVIDADGKTALLHPQDPAASRPIANPGADFALGGFYATDPYGADMVVAITTAEPATKMRRTLQALGQESFDTGRPTAMAAVEALEAELRGADFRLGAAAVHTCPQEGCGQ